MKQKKKREDMTFQEYWEEEKKKGKSNQAVENAKHAMLQTLRREGFTDKQVNEMKMDRVWKLYVDSQIPFFDKFLTDVSVLLKIQPKLASTINPHLKKLTKQFEELNKELEEQIKRQNKKKE